MKRFLVLAVVLTSFLSSIGSASVLHAAEQVSSVTGVTLNNSEQDKIVNYACTLNQSEVSTVSLSEMKKVRADMWDRNVPFRVSKNFLAFAPYKKYEALNTLQDVARAAGYRDKDAYVNGFKLNAALERIAIQRSVECSIRGMSHQRANNLSPFTAEVPGVISANAEILAAHPTMTSALSGPNGWAYGELDALKAAGGESNSQSGHLHTMINPLFSIYGFAETPRGNTSATYQVGVAAVSEPVSDSAVHGEHFNGTFTFPIAVSANKYNETTNVETEEVQPEADIVTELPDQYEDYEQYTVQPQNGRKTVKTITATAWDVEVESKTEEVIDPQPALLIKRWRKDS